MPWIRTSEQGVTRLHLPGLSANAFDYLLDYMSAPLPPFRISFLASDGAAESDLATRTLRWESSPRACVLCRESAAAQTETRLSIILNPAPVVRGAEP